MQIGKKKKISVLIPDGESHLLIYIINCLSLVKNVKVYIMSSKRHDHMKYSRFVRHYAYYPDVNDEDWISNIDNEVNKHNIDVIMPIFEFGIRRIIKNTDKLKFKDRLCNLPSLLNFDTARNKGMLYSHLIEKKIPSPKSIIVKQEEELSNIKGIDFPVVAKPVEGFGGGLGIKLLKTNKDLLQYYNLNTFNCDTIIQEFIEGYDICCNVLCENGKLLAYSIQKGTVFGKGNLSPQIGFSFVNDDILLENTKELMESLNWSGVANIDWRYDVNQKLFKVIEINTRFWFNTDASCLAKVNFPYLYCLSALNYEFKIQKATPMPYLNLKGLVRRLKENPILVFNIKYLIKNTPISFVLRDPIPVIYKFIWRTKNIIIKKLR